jgi:hypothetical protein
MDGRPKRNVLCAPAVRFSRAMAGLLVAEDGNWELEPVVLIVGDVRLVGKIDIADWDRRQRCRAQSENLRARSA